jgi:hypothetical protein
MYFPSNLQTYTKGGKVRLRNLVSRRHVQPRRDQIFAVAFHYVVQGLLPQQLILCGCQQLLRWHAHGWQPQLVSYAPATWYVILSFLREILLEFLVPVMRIDVIVCVDVICSSRILACMISLIYFYDHAILFTRIKYYDNLLIYSIYTLTCLLHGPTWQRRKNFPRVV